MGLSSIKSVPRTPSTAPSTNSSPRHMSSSTPSDRRAKMCWFIAMPAFPGRRPSSARIWWKKDIWEWIQLWHLWGARDHESGPMRISCNFFTSSKSKFSQVRRPTPPRQPLQLQGCNKAIEVSWGRLLYRIPRIPSFRWVSQWLKRNWAEVGLPLKLE